jgi:muramoyltetrapeptide carboxypeptidase LdcA involved in peptidoglycan recycling
VVSVAEAGGFVVATDIDEDGGQGTVEDAGGEAVEGRLWGGNQSIVAWQLATDRYLPDPDALDGAVLCLETSEIVPDPDMVAATVMCLGERGLLERFEGVLVGRPPTRSHRRERPPEERNVYREELYEAVIEEVGCYNPESPVVLGLDWGHTTPIAPLPIGGRVRVDPAAGTVRSE